mmetsp:Transcript_16434/g.25543  ORF Transcript_16434/g.25543 Transcript_16434/m.25543 type:complete len:147 (+) Transcript_16434:884-1324(+)
MGRSLLLYPLLCLPCRRMEHHWHDLWWKDWVWRVFFFFFFLFKWKIFEWVCFWICRALRAFLNDRYCPLILKKKLIFILLKKDCVCSVFHLINFLKRISFRLVFICYHFVLREKLVFNLKLCQSLNHFEEQEEDPISVLVVFQPQK